MSIEYYKKKCLTPVELDKQLFAEDISDNGAKRFFNSSNEDVFNLLQSNNGTSINDVHKQNIQSIAITLRVSNCGTLFNDLHPSNMQDIISTWLVSNNGTLFNLLHSVNMFAMPVTLLVSNNGTYCKLQHL